jgi:hypothetical protein
VNTSNSSTATKEVFDIIYSISVVEHVESPVNAIKSLVSQLAPDGRLILTLDVDLSNFGRHGLTVDQLSGILQIGEINFEPLSAIAGCPHVQNLATPKDGWFISSFKNSLDSRRQQAGQGILSWVKDVKKLFRGKGFDGSNICVLKLVGRK